MPIVHQDKRPREYAAEITRLPSRKERLDELSKVPEEIRDLVRKHVTNYFLLNRQ